MGRTHIRFLIASQPVVWDELSSNRDLSLVRVGFRPGQVTRETLALQSIYTGTPPYVFLHVCVTGKRHVRTCRLGRLSV